MMEIDEGSRLGLEVLQTVRDTAPGRFSEEEWLFMSCNDELKAAGYGQYEISIGPAGLRIPPHLKYWQREPYLGFGAGGPLIFRQRSGGPIGMMAAYVAAISEGKSAA